jgi:phosphoserine phosphatase RsbU/P
MDEELKLAARVQQDFLPRALPKVPGVNFWSLYRPAGFVSGDLYDVMRLDESHVGIYMADAVGHGMPAALLSMFLKNALVTKEIGAGGYRLLSPGEALARLNDALVSQNLSQATFATAVYAVLDVHQRTLTVSRGGHPNPLRLRRDGEMEVVQTDGSLLGIFPDEAFAQTTIELQSGDRIFLFTDGIEVALCRDLSLDAQQWRDEILARRDMPTSALIQEIAGAIDRTNPRLRDDLTMIVMDID